MAGRAWMQGSQHPQLGTNTMTTWSPTARLLTPGPSSSTTPDASWPSTMGRPRGRSPLITERSEWHRPAAPILTSTSPGPGGSRVMVSMVTGFSLWYGGCTLVRRRTAALICIVPSCGEANQASGVTSDGASAIDRHFDARDELCRVAGQEQGGSGHVLGRREAAQRNGRQEPGTAFRCVRSTHEQFKPAGDTHDGANGVHAAAVRTQFDGHCFEQRLHGCFRAVVPAQAGAGPDAGHGTDVQDDALARGPHDGYNYLRHVVDGLDVDGEHAVEGGFVGFQQGLVLVGDGGVVDHDGDRAEFVLAALHGGLDLLAVGHVDFDRHGIGTDAGGDFLCAGEVDVSDDDFRALFGEKLGDALAEAAGGTGDDSGFVL